MRSMSKYLKENNNSISDYSKKKLIFLIYLYWAKIYIPETKIYNCDLKTLKYLFAPVGVAKWTYVNIQQKLDSLK